MYITVRGELPAYLCVVGIGNNCPTPPATVNQSTNSPATGASTDSTTIINNPSGTQSSSIISNPPSSTASIGSPPTIGNVGTTSSSTIIFGGESGAGDSGGSGGSVGCDVYGDTDPSICAAINSLNSGYQPIDSTGFPGDNGNGEME